MLQNVTKMSKMSKNEQSINSNKLYYCKYCDYTTSKKNNYVRHKNSKKTPKKCNKM